MHNCSFDHHDVNITVQGQKQSVRPRNGYYSGIEGHVEMEEVHIELPEEDTGEADFHISADDTIPCRTLDVRSPFLKRNFAGCGSCMCCA